MVVPAPIVPQILKESRNGIAGWTTMQRLPERNYQPRNTIAVFSIVSYVLKRHINF